MASSVKTTTAKLDTMPDEILLLIAGFTGENSCYLGYGSVNKRLNQLFNTYSTKLSKTTSFGGYAKFRDIIKPFNEEKETLRWICYDPTPMYHIVSGVVCFNRKDLFEFALGTQNSVIFRHICWKSFRYKKVCIVKKVLGSIKDEKLLTIMRGKESRLIAIASREGDLDSLKYLHEELSSIWDSYACSQASRGGHLECLIYLHENGCEWNWTACSAAAGNGHLRCLIYLHENGCPLSSTVCAAAACDGKLECLVYLHENSCPWNSQACRAAVRNGHLECLVYLYENGCEWNHHVCTEAAWNGHLACLVYLHENGCPWNSDACTAASRFGKLDCLKYMQDNGLEWDKYNEFLGSFE